VKKAILLALLEACVGVAATPSIGIFPEHVDVGVNPRAGGAEYDPATHEYRVTGGGANIWAAADAFHYVWQKVSGDITFTADVHWVGTGTVAHRKAALMIRQSLDPDSPYADVALHGDGLTSLQYRTMKGASTQEVRSALNAPVRIRIERHDDQFTLYAGDPAGKLQADGPITVTLKDPVYVGLAVCSHDANVLETAVFSNLSVETKPRERLTSVISIFDLAKNYAQVLLRVDHRVEAPNWSPDGKYLMVNSGGDLFRIDLDGSPQMARIDLGAVHGANNDHGISPDGRTIAISARGPDGGSQVYLAGAGGSKPRLMTPQAPSYFHGFAPDGKYFAFVGQREDNFDLFRMPLDGGAEERLTTNPGYDDGPDYSPDGQWIYFNSDRSGSWDIWRIPASGAGPDDARAQRVTSDELEDWFPHPSPDGKWIVFLSFPKGTKGHPPNQRVLLRRIPAPGAEGKAEKPETLMRVFGGQGTMNVNSWSPDSTRFAFVRYELPLN
jgi:regulation of enolase protein 1 (concanavalin A-like superfamily)